MDIQEFEETHYDQLQEAFKEMLYDSGRYSNAMIRSGEINDGRDEFIKDQYNTYLLSTLPVAV